MNKRDEVIDAAKAFLVEDIGEPTNETEREYFNEIVDTLADFALSREAEVRREIADDLQEHFLICWAGGLHRKTSR